MATKRSMTKFIIKNGLTYYNMVQKKKITLSEFKKTFLNGDLETLEKLLDLYSQNSYNTYYKYYTKLDCIDEAIKLSDNKYHHLSTIRDVVKMDTIVDKILDEKTYLKALSVYYGELLLNKIFKDKLEFSLEYEILISEEKDSFYQIVMKKIDNYYISIITK